MLQQIYENSYSGLKLNNFERFAALVVTGKKSVTNNERIIEKWVKVCCNKVFYFFATHFY